MAKIGVRESKAKAMVEVWQSSPTEAGSDALWNALMTLYKGDVDWVMQALSRYLSSRGVDDFSRLHFRYPGVEV